MTTMFLGLTLALASALATNLSFLFKQRGAVLAAPIHVRHPLKSASGLFRSRWFAIGWAVSVLAWVMHAGALSRAPLSTVQAVLSGGLAFLAVLAERFFGFHLGRRQWLGVMITAAGLAIVGLTGGGQGPGRSSLAALIAVESAVFALGAGLVVVSTHHSVKQRREGLFLATAAGALFGVSDVAVKYLTHAHGPLLGLISPWTLAAVISFVVSFYASARSLQVGLPIEVIAITSVTANLAAILGGILIFGESIGSGAVGITGRMLAFLLVIGGAAMIPAPLRLEAARPNPGPNNPPDHDRGPDRSARAPDECFGFARMNARTRAVKMPQDGAFKMQPPRQGEARFPRCQGVEGKNRRMRATVKPGRPGGA